VIEADRVDTPMDLIAYDNIRMGVKLDEDGAPQSYFIFDEHPAEAFTGLPTWREVAKYGAASGEQMVLHVFERMRPGLTRGIPALAPVIETLKQLDRFSEAELMKAVVSSFFTVFLKTQNNDGLAGIPGIVPPDHPGSPNSPSLGQNEIVMGPGSVVDIGADEEVVPAQSTISTSFDPFFAAVVRQIGVALGIPYELLVMHFTASYSASRAALEMAAQFFRDRREWIVTNFCEPVYEWFLIDAINAGLIEAPGFFVDPVRRSAWLAAEWIGPARIILDPLKEWKAEEAAVNMGARTLERVIIEKTGADFETTTDQRGKEHAKRVDLKLEPPILNPDGSQYQIPEDPAANPAAAPKKTNGGSK
jgi:lambda family phage portal protein